MKPIREQNMLFAFGGLSVNLFTQLLQRVFNASLSAANIADIT
jgi:hypothetical protein